MKTYAKYIARGVARILVLPSYTCYSISSLLLDKRKCFQAHSQLWSLFPGTTGEYLRREYYRLTLNSCSRNCCISFGTIFSSPNASIGENVYIGAYCVIGEASLGDDTLIASRVSIVSGTKQHGTEQSEIPIREQTGQYETVSIGQDCWIGEGAIVAANIGAHSVVGAGSVVISEIAANSIAAGNPAELKKRRG